MADAPDIRLVAVDIDGTFMRSNYSYDRARFAALRRRMAERGIHFVVASGNQYEQLAGHFDDPGEFSYVADNGALVRDRDEVVFTAGLSPSDADRVIRILDSYPDLPYLASGPGHAWVPESVGARFVEEMSLYYPSIDLIPSVHQVNDRLFKFCIEDHRGIAADLLGELHASVGDVVTPVSSGHGSLDLIIPGVHKAHGLQLLMDRWGLVPEQAAAFGDGGNDIEMLQLCGYSVAMANATDAVKAAAKYVIGQTNNEDGVLITLDEWIR